jgi:hypothetical protein
LTKKFCEKFIPISKVKWSLSRKEKREG